MTRLTDTAPEAERVLIDAYRSMPVRRKWLLLGESFATARLLHAAGVRLRNSAATRREIHESWLRTAIDLPPLHPCLEPNMDVPLANLQVLREVAAAFTGLGIAYALGGSMASSIYGIARFTRDADLTVEPFPGKEAALVACFGPDYYVSLPAVEEANARRSSFNIIQVSLGFKVDVFVRKDEPFERSALARRIPVELPGTLGETIHVHSPEDVVLFKLNWYRLGGESSEQQWADILGVVKVQADKLDQGYLTSWAAQLGSSELLARAVQESAG
jgi:hypothetical protein